MSSGNLKQESPWCDIYALITNLLMTFIVTVDYVTINFFYSYNNYIQDCCFYQYYVRNRGQRFCESESVLFHFMARKQVYFADINFFEAVYYENQYFEVPFQT